MRKIITCRLCGMEKPKHGKGLCDSCYHKERRRLHPTIITCRLCGETKPLFAKGCCQACYLWERYQTDPDYVHKRAEDNKKYRQSHPDAVNRRLRDWKARNSEKVKQYAHKSYMKHRVRNLETKSKWWSANKNEINARRRAKYVHVLRHPAEIDHPWRFDNMAAFQKRTISQDFNGHLGMKQVSDE